MVKNSFKFKIVLVFLIPLAVLGYFAYYFVSLKYDALQRSEFYLYVAQNIKNTSRLIHTIQLERGLSAGYIVVQNRKEKERIKQQLMQRHRLTDMFYSTWRQYVDDNNAMKQRLDKLVDYKNKKFETMVKEHFSFISEVRQKILRSQMSFCEEMDYYTGINSALLDLMYVYLTSYNRINEYSIDIFKLEKLKEYAGLERAYGYNYLLRRNKDAKNLEIIKELVLQQKKYEKEFFLDSPNENLLFYKNSVDLENQRRLERLRNALQEKKIDAKDAAQWFKTTTMRINQLEHVSIEIIRSFEKRIEASYEQERKALVMAVAILVLAVVSALFLVIYLLRLISKEEKLLEDLRIASYTFDSQEAVTITDKDARIIRINNAFSEITGYSSEEAVGNTPSILKSGRHGSDFYEDMWNKLLNEGKWSGEIYNKRKNGEIYPEKLSITAIKDDKGNTTHYIAQFVDISEIKEAEQRAVYQASHDFLTKLPNRKSMMQKLQEEFIRAKRHDYINAFLFLDLDGFKKINDTFGHTVGDRVLVEIAQRLRNVTRSDDYLARISGDEFCIMLLNLEHDEQKAAHIAKTVCEKIIRTVSQPIEIDEHTILLGASIGVKLFPDGVSDINDVINGADTAMYKAKENGKNQYVFFNDELEERIKELSQLEQEIKQAFLHDEFIFFMQPKVDVKSEKKVTGAEMLVRWKHPKRGLLFPGAFIDVVKELGKQSDITFMALKQACSFLQHNSMTQGTLSINVSSLELITEGFLQKVADIIEEFGVDATRLEFEILENELIENFELVLAKIKELKRMGLEISIDDFGTGYSSISYLRKLPVDTLKIDRYFVQNLEDEANRKLVVMILDIAKTFGFKVVVEGVESKEQLAFIKQNGAEVYQGFLFSQAVPPEEFAKML